MFWHVFKYRLKCLLRERVTLFWTLLFPLLMATLFHFTFGHLTSEVDAFQPIKTAVIDNAAYRESPRFQEVVETLAKPGDSQFLDLVIVDAQEADGLLERGEVTGVITVGAELKLTVKQRGLQQTILKGFLDSYSQTLNTAEAIATIDPDISLGNRLSFTEAISFSNASPDTVLGFFHALIALACLYGSYWGIRNTLHLQADQSPQAARRSSAPTSKSQIVLSDTLAALVISFSEILILLAYLRFGLGLSFGSQLGFILLTSLVGSACGVALGNFVGTVVRKEQGVKYAVLIIVNTTFSFLAGLMGAEVKDSIAQNAPFLSYLNPSTLIADSFYSLYVYDTYERFWLNIAVLSLITVFLSLASSIHLRRERYASI